MPIETIEFNGKDYPLLQSEGFASQYSFVFAKKFLDPVGVIYDIGFSNPEWQYPGSIGIDINTKDRYDAMNLPPIQADGIYSSHCLEHLPNYVAALNYWWLKLKPGGVLFLYLPNCEYQEYWRPFFNKKHLHLLSPHLIELYFRSCKNMWNKYFVTEGYDLNGSFYCVAEKI